MVTCQLFFLSRTGLRFQEVVAQQPQL